MNTRMRRLLLPLLTAFAVVAAPMATPQTAKTSSASRKAHEQILKAYGVYADQGLQDYINELGQRIARRSTLPDAEWVFVVLDDDSINAFTTGCCFVYLHRGLLMHLNSEAELASVIGHEIAHVTQKHPQKRQTQGILASLGALAATLYTGSAAVAELANIGAQAWMQGYGRENEMEADRVGLLFSTAAGYRPEAMAEVFEMFKRGERFEIDRARAEGRQPRVYHGLFSSHPAPNARAIQAYLRRIDGLTYGSSRAQGIVRGNRFYHAELGITLAVPRGWTLDNQRDRLIAYTPARDTFMQVTVEGVPPNQGPREFLYTKLKGANVRGTEPFTVDGMQGFTAVTASGSSLDKGAGPVRWAVLYRGNSAYLFAGASRASARGVPEADGLFKSVVETLRGLKPAEFPLAEPFRVKIRTAEASTRLEDYAAAVPVERFQKEELQLINGLYPNGAPKPGSLYKVVE
jgi:predicted Zn-dependent protease